MQDPSYTKDLPFYSSSSFEEDESEVNITESVVIPIVQKKKKDK